MRKSGGTLKHSTGRAKIRHMNMVMDFKASLKELQTIEADRIRRTQGLEACQNLRDMMSQAEYDAWWTAAPEHGFFEAARAKLSELRKTEDAAEVIELEAISEWTEDDHVYR